MHRMSERKNVLTIQSSNQWIYAYSINICKDCKEMYNLLVFVIHKYIYCISYQIQRLLVR